MYNVTLPAMFTTGTLDSKVTGPTMENYFKSIPAHHKVFVNLADAYHMEPQEGMRLNVLTAQFLSCHVGQVDEDCEVIYGKGPHSICKVNEYETCSVVGHAPTANFTIVAETVTEFV